MKPIIIDVREPFEFMMGHVKGVLNIPSSDLMAGATKLADVDKDAQLILYCRTGSRSNVGIQILQGLGYKNLINGINKQQVEAKYFQ